MRKSSRLVFVLSTGVTAVIVWLLLLYPEFLADKRTSVKGLLVFRKERTPNVRKQPTKVMSSDEYLLRRGFSIQEVFNFLFCNTRQENLTLTIGVFIRDANF